MDIDNKFQKSSILFFRTHNNQERMCVFVKGVILAGGTGSRLQPMTKITNKHLLPVGPYPMIYWSIMKLKEAGIHEILLITHEEYMSSFQKLLEDGAELGVSLRYEIQPTASGISAGLAHAKDCGACPC